MDAYIGKWQDEAEFTKQYYAEEGTLDDVPEAITRSINWDEVWRYETQHNFYEINGYYFRNI
jgi:hypothetical protein